MKFFFISITIIALYSCSHHSSKTKKLDSAVLKQYQGNWIRKDYIDQLRKTKSPLQSQEDVWGLSFFSYNGEIKSDTLFFYGALNNHEGYQFIVFSSVQDNFNDTFATNIALVNENDKISDRYKLTLTVDKTDTLLCLLKTDETNKIVDRKYYYKSNQNSFVNTVREIVIVGDYTDAKNSENKIQFKNDGTLTGIKNYDKYDLITDFIGPYNNMDQLILYDQQNKEKLYGLEWKGDSLFLFDVTENQETDILEKKEVLYVLVKR